MSYKKKVRILMISSSSELGGGAKHMFLLGENLNKKFEVFYAIPKSKNFGKFFNSKNHIPISERKISLKDIFLVNSFIKKYSIDIVHAHGKGASVIARICQIFRKRNLIYTFHGVHIKCHNFFVKIIYLIYENILGKLDTVKVFVSKSEKELAKSLNIYLGSNIIINNGVLNKTKKFSIKKEYPEKKIIKNIKVNVVTIARFVAQKNIQEIIKISQKLPSINFVIIGDGQLWEKINKQVRNLKIKNIKLIGKRKNVFKYLYNADIYLSTSLYEGLPISILEAMSVGLPVVASNVVGNCDVIENNKSGFFYDLNNTEMAIKFIKLLADDKRKRNVIGNNAFKRQRQLFSINKMLKSYEKLYEKLLIN